jgi:hypothetical protein
MGYLNNEQQLTVDKNGITVNSGYLSLSGSILTSFAIDRLNNISNTNLLPLNNIWTGVNSFYQPIYQNINQNNISIGSDNIFNFGGTNNVVVGNGSLKAVISASSNNTSFGTYNMQSITSSLNSTFGFNCFSITTSGNNNSAVGVSVFIKNVTGSFNTGIGNNSGGYMLGSNNSCFGAYSGQSSTDTNTYSNSTALGYSAIINSSNQIMLGTATETVYIPNKLILAGTDVLTTMNTKISSALTTFVNSDHAYVSTVGSSFTGSMIFTGASKGQNITLYNGNMSFTGLSSTSIALSVASGVSNFQAITATSINSINFASSPAVNSIYKSTNGVGMRSQVYTLSAPRDFTATDFSNDQFIIYYTNQVRYPILNIPNSNLCEGQRLTIINLGLYDLQINTTSSFIGKNQTNTGSFLITSQQIFELISGYTWWIVVSIN